MTSHQLHPPKYSKRLAHVIWWLIVATLLSFAGPSGARAAAKSIVWEKGDQLVQLIAQDIDSAIPNDHPRNVSASEVSAMLKTLRLQYADEEPGSATVAVFTSKELENLGRAVAAGLGRADSSQDLIFYVIGSHRIAAGAFSRRNRVSAGRIFYRDGNLNIIFGQIQTPYRKKNLYGQTNDDFYPRNYGSRSTAADHEVVLVTGATIQSHESSDGVRKDWIVVQGIGDAGEIPGPPTISVDANHSESVKDEVDTVPTSVLTAPELQPISESESTVDSPDRSADVEKVRPAPVNAGVEDRLRALRHLRDSKLISEDAYESKMKEILQDL